MTPCLVLPVKPPWANWCGKPRRFALLRSSTRCRWQTPRRGTVHKWQEAWDISIKGRWTHRHIPCIESWESHMLGQVDFYLTHVLSGHGCFRSYLRRMGAYPVWVSPDLPRAAAARGDNLARVQPETVLALMLRAKGSGRQQQHLQKEFFERWDR